MNPHTTILRRIFVSAAIFLLLAGVVFRLFVGASPLFELLGLIACAAPTALILFTRKHWHRRLAKSAVQSPGFWLAGFTALGIAAVHLSCLLEQHSSSDIIPVWSGVILAFTAVFTMMFVRKHIPGHEWVVVLEACIFFFCIADNSHATAGAVVICIVYLSVLVLALVRRFFSPFSRVSLIIPAILLYNVALLFTYSSFTWELHKWWDALTRAPFNDESVESWWTIVARDVIANAAFFDGVPNNLPMSEPLFSGTLLSEAVLAQSSNGYQLLHMISRWGWFGVLPILIAMAAFLICGYLLVLRRRGMHTYVSLAAMTAMAVPMLLSLSQNLGYTVVLVDKMPLLGFSPIGNVLWALMVCLVVSKHSIRIPCSELLPQKERKAHQQRYQTAVFSSLETTHFDSGDALLRSDAAFHLLRRTLQDHVCDDKAYTHIELLGNFNGIADALRSMCFNAATDSSALVVLERWTPNVPAKDTTTLGHLIFQALPDCDELILTKITNIALPTGFWAAHIILPQESGVNDCGTIQLPQEEETA